VRPEHDEFDLRLAAKAADRATAARQQWPIFEQRLRELGHGPRSIEHAFSALSGPGTVAEALDGLNGISGPESPPLALGFDVTETHCSPEQAGGVAITSVERGGSGIRVEVRHRRSGRLRWSRAARRGQGRSRE
jgi:hypothetical protein